MRRSSGGITLRADRRTTCSRPGCIVNKIYLRSFADGCAEQRITPGRERSRGSGRRRFRRRMRFSVHAQPPVHTDKLLCLSLSVRELTPFATKLYQSAD